MDKAKVINDILRLVPEPAEGEARSRSLLEELDISALVTTRSNLTALVEEGGRLLASADADRFSEYDNAARERLRAVEASRHAIEAIGRSLKLEEVASISLSNRGPNDGHRPVVTDVPVGIDRNTWHHISDLQNLVSSMKRWPGFHSELPVAAVDQVVHAVIDRVNSATLSPSNDSRAALYKNQADGARWLAHAQKRVSLLLHHPLIWSDSPSLDIKMMVEGLGRLSKIVAQTRPDVVVAINPEGLAIWRLVEHNLKLKLPTALVRGSAESGLAFDPGIDRGHYERAMVIGHVAWSGATVVETARLARSRLKSDDVIAAVLATSTYAAERVNGVSRFAFHCIAAGSRIQLGINPAELRITDAGDQSRDTSSNLELAIPGEAIRAAQMKFSDRYC